MSDFFYDASIMPVQNQGCYLKKNKEKNMLMKFDSEKNINKSLAITDLIQQYIKVIHSRVNWYTEGFI